jgi:hypothetical protein
MPDPNSLNAWFERKVQSSEQVIKQVGGAIGELGADEMRRRTDRVDTGLMIGSISSRVESTADEVIAKFGYLDKTEFYFKLQTVTGFTTRDGRFIGPTFALRDAYEYAKNYAERLLGDGLRNA